MLNGKTAIITGCNRGIGRSITEVFVKNRAKVVACARIAGALEDSCKELEDKYGTSIIRKYFDVADYEQVKNAFKEISQSPAKDLDILVNNAGINIDALLGMTDPKVIKQTFDVNTFGTLYMMQYAARLMMRKKQGSIINMTSIMGINGAEGQSIYSGSKAAVIGITKSAAKELAPYNIRVNAIAPGFIYTDMTKRLSASKFVERVRSIKLGRAGRPEEVANCALFLASELSSYVTGQIIGVDGAMVL